MKQNGFKDRGLFASPPFVILVGMLGNDYLGQNCSIARALEAVGERWTLLIVRELLRKPRRFSELERRLEVSKNVLTSRLAKLVHLQVVETVSVQDTNEWKTYRLTDKGRDLFPVVNALMAWGDRYEAPRGPPALLHHNCGHAPGHKVVCEACGEPVEAHSVRVTAGPGWDLSESDKVGGKAPRRF